MTAGVSWCVSNGILYNDFNVDKSRNKPIKRFIIEKLKRRDKNLSKVPEGSKRLAEESSQIMEVTNF